MNDPKNGRVLKQKLPVPREETWELLESYLSFLLQLPAREAQSFLADLAQERPKFAKRLEELLQVDANREWVLDQPLLELSDSPESEAEAMPETLADYRLLKKLGDGGMGIVYLAERGELEGDERVAIKVLRQDYRSVLKHYFFQREAAILAKLNHPFIARLLDSGVTAEGTPYLVMDYIEGKPLATYFEENEASPKEILTMFLKVCEAVEFAHQHLVIHRDIKPENLLVTADGVPKLLDFGISKIFADDAECGSRTTTMRLLTPQYASPEQLFDEPVSLRTDQFSLGVMLYEQLTGQKPYRVPASPKIKDLANLFQKDPEKPSALWRKQRRGKNSPQSDRQSFPKDIDLVIGRAIRPEPGKRYASVQHFADDISRVLEGRSIHAPRENLTYLFDRLIRRHPFVCTGLLIFVLALGSLSWGLYQEKREAEVQREKAEMNAKFLSSLFDLKHLFGSEGAQIPARVLIDRAADELETIGNMQDDQSAELWAILGNLYFKLGLSAQAEKAYSQSMAMTPLQGSPQRSCRLIDLAYVKIKQGRIQDAGQILKAEFVEYQDFRKLPGDYPARYLLVQAIVELEKLAFASSQALFEDALESLGDEPQGEETRVMIQMGLGQLYQRMGELDSAETNLIKASELSEALYGPKHPRVASIYINLGSLYSSQKKWALAVDYFHRSIAIIEKSYGTDSPQLLYPLNNLGIVYGEFRDFRKAEAVLSRGEAIGLQHFGERSQEVAAVWTNMAIMQNEQGYYEEAAASYEKIIKGHLSPDKLVKVRKNYADTLIHLRRFSEAADQLRAALDSQKQVFGEKNKLVAFLHLELGKCYNKQGILEQARSHFRVSAETMAQLFPEDHPNIVATLIPLGQVSARLGAVEESMEYFERALAIQVGQFDKGHPQLKYLLTHYAQAARWVGLEEKADELKILAGTLGVKLN